MDIKVESRSVVVFDLDDTLYNEMEYLRSAYMHIAKKLDPKNWQALFARMYSLFRSKKDVFEFISITYNVDKAGLIQDYRTHVPILHLFDGVLKTIQCIKVKNGKIGVITDGRSTTQRTKLNALGILEFIDKIVISDEIGSEKPDEKNYLAIEEAFENCNYLYMADNLRKDFITPNKRGWKTIGIIDNGLNMHFDGHNYFGNANRPQEFAMSFEDINIV